MGPFYAPYYSDNSLALAHCTHSGLQHETVVWACIINFSEWDGCRSKSSHWPRCEHTSLDNEIDLVHSSLKTIMCTHSHGPISCTVLLRQFPRIGPLCAQWAAARDCHVGLHHKFQ